MFTDPNWQDTFLGGTILAGMVVIAVIAAILTWATWDQPATAATWDQPAIAQRLKTTVGAAIKPAPSIPPR
jgi:hypothetical protein